jgi:ABC-type dipeptide/oligopeptide/nickel transport system permease component
MATSHCSYWCSKFFNLCGIFLAVGLLPQLLPGPPVALYESWPSSPQQRALLVKEYGFDHPLPVQFGTWLRRMVTGRWGNSRFHNRPVLTDVMQAAGFTLLLLLWTGLACGLWMGLLWGGHRLLAWPGLPMRRGPPLFLLEAFPGFLIAVVLHDLAVWQLGWLGMANVSLWQPYAIFNPLYMLFPGTILAILPLLAWCTSTPPRRAPGQSWWQHTGGQWQHFCRHFRPLLAGFLLEVLLTEHVLTLPGLGSLGITALKRRDFPLLQGFLLCTGGLYWLLRLLADRDIQAAGTSHTAPAPPTLLRRLTSNRQVIYSGVWGLLLLLVLAALAARLAPYSPTEIHSQDQLLRPG